MPEVRLTNVVSFSSEDPAFKAENLLTSSEVKKWRTLTEGESQLTAVLQMEKGGQISMIEIGNYGSAFVEIQVGRKGSIEQDGNFHVLLDAASFMSPIESRLRTKSEQGPDVQRRQVQCRDGKAKLGSDQDRLYSAVLQAHEIRHLFHQSPHLGLELTEKEVWRFCSQRRGGRFANESSFRERSSSGGRCH